MRVLVCSLLFMALMFAVGCTALGGGYVTVNLPFSGTSTNNNTAGQQVMQSPKITSPATVGDQIQVSPAQRASALMVQQDVTGEIGKDIAGTGAFQAGTTRSQQAPSGGAGVGESPSTVTEGDDSLDAAGDGTIGVTP
jgi:hypothetical protein